MNGLSLSFDKGTLILSDLPEGLSAVSAWTKWDARARVFRAPAYAYREIVLALRAAGIVYHDAARAFAPVDLPLLKELVPRSHQKDALAAWLKSGSRGFVTMPTGAGKTIFAVMAIHATRRAALVHVPTIDLMHQWYEVLKKFFGEPIGLLGGGYNETHPLTVATYDSALLHVETKGNRFGLAIFDECHHLPGEQTRHVALASLAPFRLGLTATPERSDGREKDLEMLCGSCCFEIKIQSLQGSTLAPYQVETLEVEMSDADREEYEASRKVYLDFVRSAQIDFARENGWQEFLRKASRSARGREAFRAYLRQKKLSLASSAKEEVVWELLQRHAGERVLIFTQDNDMAYRLGKKYFLPVLTHHTKVREREEFLSAFRSGTFRVLVTSKVLNEGVDVPEASVAIIVSGSGTVREHVQRLGRILRAQPGKRALLYELVSKGTGEFFVNKRRRQHHAYQETFTLPCQG